MTVLDPRRLPLTLTLLFACQPAVDPSSPPSSGAQVGRCDAEIEDPFRRLEALDDPEVRAWMRERSERTEARLAALPALDGLADELAALDSVGSSRAWGTRELRSGAVLLVDASEAGERLIHRDPSGDERVLLDPREHADGAHVITYFQPSWSGERVVVGLTRDGEELGPMIVIEVASGRRLPDEITNAWPADSGGVHWLPDDSGFVYVRHPVTDPQAPGFLHGMEAVVHRLGAAPGSDQVLLSAAHDPELDLADHDFPLVYVPGPTSAYAVAVIGGATAHPASYVAPIAGLVAGAPRWRPLFGVEDKVAEFAIVGDHVEVLSARRRPEYELLRVDLADPALDHATVLAAPPPGESIAQMAVRGDELVFVRYRDGVTASLHHRDAAGAITAVTLPTSFGEIVLGGAEPVPGSSVAPGASASVEAGGWLSPRARYRYDFDARRLEPDPREPDPLGPAGPSLADLVVEERRVTAADGVEVPVSLIYRRDLVRDRARPTLIFGYGAYGLAATPRWFPPLVLWARRGGVVAIAHVRGGGEKGEAWHAGGRKQTKPNTWRDAIACAEALQSEAWGFTSPEHTAIWAISAGGILAGRAITERPELFAAAMIEVGMLNPARLEASANGDNSGKEFGSLDQPGECEALLEMDAYLHVRDGERYPAVLVTGGIHDPRVAPWEPSKFAARLEQANAAAGAGGPTLLWIDEAGGHGVGEARAARYPKLARVLGFALWRTRHPEFQP